MNQDEKACPLCGETIKAVAIRCKHCQADLNSGQPVSNSAGSSATTPVEASKPENAGRGSVPKGIGWALIVAGLLVIYYGGIFGVLAFPVLWTGFTLVFPGSSLIVRMGKGFVAMILVFAVGIAVMGSWRDVAGKSAGNVARSAQEVPISALLTAYEGNELAADSLYKGKLIQTRGILSSVNKDVLDNPYLLVEEPNKQRILKNLQCYLAPSSLNEARQAKLGGSVTVIGKVDGLLINVLLSECKLIASSTAATHARAPQGSSTSVCSASKTFAIPMQRVGKADGYECVAPGEIQAGFDCSKASNAVENAICASEDLRTQDCYVKYVYFDALNNAKDSCEQEQIASEHQAWTDRRNADCAGGTGLDQCVRGASSERARHLITRYKLRSDVYALEDFALAR